jgi:hypothetical protein
MTVTFIIILYAFGVYVTQDNLGYSSIYVVFTQTISVLQWYSYFTVSELSAPAKKQI